MSDLIPDWYQWNYRPQIVKRPAWFGSWPGNARIAVSLKIMHEWEGTPRPVVRGGFGAANPSTQDYWSLCAREYGFKEGIWRLMAVLDKHGVKATIMGSGLAATLWPDSFQELQRRGHEIASHGWDQGVHPPQFKSRDEEQMAFRRALDCIEKVTGKRPVGYMSQGPRPTVHTLDFVADEGLIWDADYHDCDIPYIMNVKGKKIVSVGYARPDFTDNDVIPLGLVGALEQLKTQFDAVYEESARHPMKFFYAMHAHHSGAPGLAKMLDQFLQYAKSHDGVWFCRCVDIANYWLENER
jgi:peptidoglycan/xylan/chitin deacetylase (PgdA/CDA1 family)